MIAHYLIVGSNQPLITKSFELFHWSSLLHLIVNVGIIIPKITWAHGFALSFGPWIDFYGQGQLSGCSGWFWAGSRGRK